HDVSSRPPVKPSQVLGREKYSPQGGTGRRPAADYVSCLSEPSPRTSAAPEGPRRPACLAASVSRYSTCALTLLSSSAAHLSSASKRLGWMRSRKRLRSGIVLGPTWRASACRAGTW